VRETQVCRLTDEEKRTEIPYPVDALEHANTEVEAAHIHRICSFSFPGSHLHGGLGLMWRTGSSGCRSVDRYVNIIVDELILRGPTVRKTPRLEEMVRKDGQ
jgi:hypothetical protein